MADRLVDGASYDWTPSHLGGARSKGKTRYQHLLDGNARELDIYDYGYTSPRNFLVTLRKVARDRGMTFRTKTVNYHTVGFQVTGHR